MRKTQKASRLLFYGVFFTLCIFFGIMLVANGKKWYERMMQEKAIAAMQEEIARLKSEQQGQQALLEKLQSPFFIEREGREKFGAKKPGERIVLFPKRDEGEREGLERLGEQKKESPFFTNWFRYFFHAPM